VSSVDQNTDRQLEGLELDKVFTDKASGKDTKRPQLQAALDYIREGDVLIVHSMDRLARNLDDLRKMVLDLTKKGVHVQFIKENLTFTGEDSPMSNLLLSLLGAVAEFERSMIRERQREGIALAKKAGVYKGRKPSLTASDMTRSGDSERAAASASRGQVKNLAEKPFIRNMAARLDAMTGSSSTTKMREPGDTWGLFRVFHSCTAWVVWVTWV
jgi:DNA invertase Pin-like site-specific DNA recombinase